ncbi:MAG TPA: zinc-binding dehydrogenase [Chloroflexota bacterium]|jgi:L-iditol 2-dehydrogenase|nr:zinc-binding dehydrogenase [Chloroflexota bacterium]
MKALQKTAPGVGNVELRDVPEPKAGQGQVVLEVGYTGICGTDLHIYLDEYRCVPPVTLGHEVAGTIAEVGPGVSGWALGERVTTETYFYTCGRCVHCLTGAPNLCPQRRSIGTHVDGGFAGRLLVPADRLHRVPEALDLRAAAMSEPLACCIHGLVDLAQIRPGDTVVVSGPGPIGLLCLQVARAAGARTVLCGVDGDELRLEIGREVGASHAVNVAREPLAKLLDELTGGQGPEVVVEAAGAAASLRQCLEVARRGGTVVQVGLYGRPIEVDVNLVPMKQLKLVGTFAHVPWAWDRALELMASGRVLTAPLISDVAPLEAWEAKFEALRQKRDCKVLLTPIV